MLVDDFEIASFRCPHLTSDTQVCYVVFIHEEWINE